jgi:hypothetical protein
MSVGGVARSASAAANPLSPGLGCGLRAFRLFKPQHTLEHVDSFQHELLPAVEKKRQSFVSHSTDHVTSIHERVAELG